MTYTQTRTADGWKLEDSTGRLIVKQCERFVHPNLLVGLALKNQCRVADLIIEVSNA